MNSEIRVKQEIENALKKFLDEQQPLRDAAIKLLNVLGYHSQRVGNDEIDSNRYDRLVESALVTANLSDKLRINDWDSFCQIMQVTDAEINQQVTPEQGNLFESSGIDDMLRTSYMFVAVQLSERHLHTHTTCRYNPFYQQRVPKTDYGDIPIWCCSDTGYYQPPS